MKKTKILPVRYLSATLLAFSMSFLTYGQSTMPEVLLNGTLKEQMDFITEKTRIYEDFRAIREDMFQKIRNNVIDSLTSAGSKIDGLNRVNSGLNNRVDSLNTSLGSLKNNLEDITKSKDSISIAGIEIKKSAYNGIVWTIILALLGILALGFMVFKRNISVTARTRKDYEDLKKEFEAYRKASREAREKMSMAHFYELKKIRGG